MVKKAENRSFEAVIFDMDGVIFDTEHLAMSLRTRYSRHRRGLSLRYWDHHDPYP